MQTAVRRSVLSARTPRPGLPPKRPTRLRGPGGLVSQRRGARRSAVVVQAGVDPVERALGSAPYLLPLLDGLKYGPPDPPSPSRRDAAGTYIFNAYPVFTRVLFPVFPAYELYVSLPFSSLILFFALYFGLARNRSFSRFVRFNAMQAILIDILLILPSVLLQVLRMSAEVRVFVYNVTWLYVFSCTAIGIVSCLVGQSARLPLVASASDAQVDRTLRGIIPVERGLVNAALVVESAGGLNVSCRGVDIAKARAIASTKLKFFEAPATPWTQKPGYQELQDYAQNVDVQSVLQEMLTELLLAKPEAPIPFMIRFLESKRQSTQPCTN